MNKFTWYIRRLAAMSGREILHRVDEQVKRRGGQKFQPPDVGPALTRLDLLTPPQPRWQAVSAVAQSRWKRDTEAAMAGNWHFLGQRWPVMQPHPDWHLDPVGGATWPRQPYCFHIPYRHDGTRGDVKYVWEINRLQILPLAAACARATGEARYRDFVLDHLASWAEANPPVKGVNWASGIELALRVVSILCALSLLDTATQARAAARFAPLLETHRLWLERFPSRFSSANNHRIAELGALYLLARVRDDGAAAGPFLSELMEECLLQIHPDGVGAEQSPTYTCFTLEWLLLALNTARRAGDPVPEAVHTRLQAAAQALRWMMDRNGNLPRIGDDDEGRVLRSTLGEEPDYVASVLASLSSYLGHPESAPPGHRPGLRALLLGLQEERSPGMSLQGERMFEGGGYSVWRGMAGAAREAESVVVMDHGPLGYLSIAAHGHADALAVWWHLDGVPVLIDAGTYLYHAGGAKRDCYRGTGMHNTLSLGGADQSLPAGAFNWRSKAHAWRRESQRGILGEHNGYERRFGVIHRRKLTCTTDGIELHDTLHGHRPRVGLEASFTYLLNPRITANPSGTGLALAVPGTKAPRELRVAASCGEGKPLAIEARPAHYSPRFGEESPTHALHLSLTAQTLYNQGVSLRFHLTQPG